MYQINIHVVLCYSNVAVNTVISRTVKTSDESWLTVWDTVLASSGAMSDLFPVHFGVRPQSHTSVKDSISSYFGTAITSFHISAKSSTMV